MIKQGNAPFYSFSLHKCADYLGMRVGEGRVERGIALFIYLSKAQLFEKGAAWDEGCRGAASFQTRRKAFDFRTGGSISIEDIIDGIKDGHFHLIAFVAFVHAFDTEIPFRHHIHLHLCGTHAVTSSDHLSEDAVAGEIAVARHEEVAQIGTADDTAVCGIQCREAFLHFLHGVGDEDTEEIVAIAQSQANAGSDGIDILQDGGVFYADDILRCRSAHIVVAQPMGKDGGAVHAGAADGQIRQAAECNLFSMTGTTDDEEIALWHSVGFAEIFGADHVFVGDDALDGCDDELRVERNAERFQLGLQVGGGSDEDERVVLMDDFIKI